MTDTLGTDIRHSDGSRFDNRDREIVERRMAARATITEPTVGDYVIFADGTVRRISYVWPDGAQTSDSGSYHLCESGRCSMSGSLYTSVPLSTLTLTGETRPGWVWIFHHNYATAHNGVDVQVPMRVWACTEGPTR